MPAPESTSPTIGPFTPDRVKPRIIDQVPNPDPSKPNPLLSAYFQDMGADVLPTPEAELRRDRIALMLRETNSPYAVTGGNYHAYTSADRSVRDQFDADLGLMINLVGAKSYAEMRDMLKSPRPINESATDKRALSSSFPNLPGDNRSEQRKKEDRRKQMEKYANKADEFINVYLRTGNWEPISEANRLQDEVAGATTVGELLKLAFDTRYVDRVRFEAKRKLVLMGLFRSIDAHSEDLQQQFRFPEFTRFFEDHIWHQPEGEKKGATRRVEILSRHDFDDYSVQEVDGYLSVQELTTREQIEAAEKRISHHKPRKGGYYLRMSGFNQRSILYNGELIPVFTDPRKKDEDSRVAKMIRKGKDDPGSTVEDATGMMLVARNVQEARKIFRHISRAGSSSSNLVEIKQVEDTLEGGRYSAENHGSSDKVRQLKFIMEQGGNKIEVIIHTYATWLRDRFMDDVDHDSYEVKRLLSSGSFELLFPQKIYNVKDEEFSELIGNQRRAKRRK